MPTIRPLNAPIDRETVIREFRARPETLTKCVFATCMIPICAAMAIWIAVAPSTDVAVYERIVYSLILVLASPLLGLTSLYYWRTRTIPQRVAVTHNSVIVPKSNWTGIHTAELEIRFHEIATLTNDRVPRGRNPEGGRLRIWLHGVRHPLPYLGVPLNEKDRIEFSLLLKQSLAHWQREQAALSSPQRNADRPDACT